MLAGIFEASQTFREFALEPDASLSVMLGIGPTFSWNYCIFKLADFI